jgi:hypothetical protein
MLQITLLRNSEEFTFLVSCELKATAIVTDLCNDQRRLHYRSLNVMLPSAQGQTSEEAPLQNAHSASAFGRLA